MRLHTLKLKYHLDYILINHMKQIQNKTKDLETKPLKNRCIASIGNQLANREGKC